MTSAFAEIAFTPSVQAEQARRGSAKAYARLLAAEADRGDRLTDREVDFIQTRDGCYQATVSETGWPYVQFRGGPVGFLKVLDDRTIAYADFRGNRQYLSTGNLTKDDRISLILMDYPNRRRLKLWGRAKLGDAADNPDLINMLHDESYRGRPERAVIIAIEAFDWNCPQHIPQRLALAELEGHLAPIRAECTRLAAENKTLRDKLAQTGYRAAYPPFSTGR